jgi:hypothetical protein
MICIGTCFDGSGGCSLLPESIQTRISVSLPGIFLCKLTLSSVLVQMGSLSSVRIPRVQRGTHDRLSIDEIGSYTILVDAQSSQYRSSPGVDLETTIRDYTDYDLLPSFFTPCFRFGPGTQMSDILEYSSHCPAEEDIIFIVHGDNLFVSSCHPMQLQAYNE